MKEGGPEWLFPREIFNSTARHLVRKPRWMAPAPTCHVPRDENGHDPRSQSEQKNLVE